MSNTVLFDIGLLLLLLFILGVDVFMKNVKISDIPSIPFVPGAAWHLISIVSQRAYHRC